MAATSPPVERGRPAPDFDLPATDGKRYALSDVAGANGTVVAFICNHCPYVVSSARRMVDDAAALADAGVGFVAICSNDATRYPADSFERMKEFAAANGFFFPYLHDETQSVAEAYGAVCTPEFFGLDRGGRLVYRGRMDGGGTGNPDPAAPRELREAMLAVARGKTPPEDQMPAVGCSIKWKAA